MTKALLVEDDQNLREIFEMRLQAEGYETLVAGDGEEALAIALQKKPDLIIADVMMPKISGFEMLETLRASPDMNNVKVIIMTALGQAEDRARGEKLGVVKYLVKSQVTLEDFVRAVREVLPPAEAAKDQGNINNKQESENKMPDDTPTNSTGQGDPMPPTNPVTGDTPPAPATPPADDQMTTAEEQNAVDKQVNDFASGAPAAPAGDSGSTTGAPGMPTTDEPPVPGPQPPVEEPPKPPMPEEGESTPPATPPTGSA